MRTMGRWRHAGHILGLALGAALLVPEVAAQTLDQAQTRLLKNFCAELKGRTLEDQLNFFNNVGPQLNNLCPFPVAAGGIGVASSNGGAAGATQDLKVETTRRLVRLRGEDRDDQRGGAAGVEPGKALSFFFTARYESLDRVATPSEDGYQSHIQGFTAGADVRWNDRLLTGIALNINRWDGDFVDAGGFRTDSFGPVLYASFLPTENSFADIAIEYARQSRDRTRLTRFSDPVTDLSASGRPSSDYRADQFAATASMGYDYPIGRFTIGPRAKLRYSHTAIDGYTEAGTSGLELRFLNDNVTSVQSVLGLHGSVALSLPFGVVVPQLDVDWTHEFKDDRRAIYVQFAQDHRANPLVFSFQNDEPDRDFYHVGAGAGLVLPHGVQPFVRFEYLGGHRYLDNYAAVVGVRVEIK